MPSLHDRQGDVLIIKAKVSSIPAGAKKVEPEQGRIVLAHGEVTGHAHVIEKDAAALFETADGNRYLEVHHLTSLKHEEHDAIKLEPGTYEVIRQVEYTPEEIRRVAD